MPNEVSNFQKVRFASSVSVMYALTLLFGWYAVRPVSALGHSRSVAFKHAVVAPHVPTKPVIAGLPVRIVIPDSGVDLPVDPGYYDAASNSWTLSGLRAQFATISSQANDATGDTFIYGHNNNSVFGALRHVTPAVGAQALIYTDNGHVFSYKFQSVVSLTPDDTSVLEYNGPPIMTIQTCTGSVDEWRTLFKFNFDKALQ